ncbi:MAG: mechanosensitive ion channel family protein [Myxococcaceae bacterium]|nr:mechanosensitive ion channel family protein [Myxococcaceae bacterium]
MGLWEALGQEAAEGDTLWVLAGFLISTVASRAFAAKLQQPRFRSLGFLLVVHLVCWVVAAGSRAFGSDLYKDLRAPGIVAGAVVLVGSIAAVLFNVLLPRLRVETPRIVQDVLVAIVSVVAGVAVASRAGVNLSGLIATSAVFTAVLGFSLQDVIGNVAGGLALQVDHSISVGDWVKVGDVTGKVTEIRWRYTALETRNWETVLVPNAVLMKSNVQVIGRRQGQPKYQRRWVYFNVDWRYQPSDVITCAVTAVKNARLERVATEPPPSCVLMEMSESYGRYAVRYHLTDLAIDDPTDSEVRTVVYFALQRAGMQLSIPAHAVFLTEDSADRREVKSKRQLQRSVRLLDLLDLFDDLTADEKLKLAEGLKHTPFASGEVMTRQGAEAHWLYVMEEGAASVRVAEGGIEREVATIHAPSFFGEMSLMTGEPRSATVVAVTDTECFRLEKSTFRDVLQARPALAEKLAEVLTRRRAELLAVREGVSAEAKLKQLRGSETDLLEKIRGFFGLSG